MIKLNLTKRDFVLFSMSMALLGLVFVFMWYFPFLSEIAVRGIAGWYIGGWLWGLSNFLLGKYENGRERS